MHDVTIDIESSLKDFDIYDNNNSLLDSFGDLVVISFYTSDEYYTNCAINLNKMCMYFGLTHDIVKIENSNTETWADICRKKIRFYKDMLLKHNCDVIWVDIDTELLRNPRPLHQGHFDMSLFARAFKYFPRNETLSMTRMFHPGYIIFRNTPKTHQFLDDCIKIEETHSGDFTDDYILEEAFRTSEVLMRLMILSPKDIEKVGDKPNPEAFFRHGDSGNVETYKGKVRQHDPQIMSKKNQKKIIMTAVEAARADGREQDLLVFMRHLRDILPEDRDTHVKFLESLRKSGNDEMLDAEVNRGLAIPQLRAFTLRFLLLRALSKGDWDRVDILYQDVRNTGNAEIISIAQARIFRSSFDRRAEAAGIPAKTRPTLYWRQVIGEMINPYVIEKLSGLIPRYNATGKGLCAAGTLDGIAISGTPVWGSGVATKSGLPAADAIYHAIRGPLSRERVTLAGGSCPEIYGDCATLLPLVYNPEVRITHKTGFIFNHSDDKHGISLGDDIHAFCISCSSEKDIESFIKNILSCERIISNALYGIIIAHAYGIPAAWAVPGIGKKHNFEFMDYFASVGFNDDIIPYNTYLSEISNHQLPESIFVLPKRPLSLTALLKAAPFPVLSESLVLAYLADLRNQNLL